MPSSASTHKIKINLADYPYRRDIENRLFMAQLTVFEVQVLQEILHYSLRLSVEQLAETLESSVQDLLPILDKLSESKLFKRQHLTLIVDKDMRKYFEFQLAKFNEDFEPNLDFLQNILSKVPIHVLPIWYALPRTSDHIFASIIEKYFLSPKIYHQHLEELQFDDPILHALMQDVYQSPQFRKTSAELMAKHHLSRERFEECLLLLEYHFVCFLSYTRIENKWQEVVTPLAEWLDYLQFEANVKPIPIKGPIETHYATEFGFIKDLTTFLQASAGKKIFPKDVKNLYASTPAKQAAVIHKLIQIGFAKQNAKGQLEATEKGIEWASKPMHAQIAELARTPLNTLADLTGFNLLWNTRNLRLIEKSLRRLPPHEWVDLTHFLKGFIAPLGDREPVTLKNRGKKWKYVLPSYSEQELRFIEAVILEKLDQLGVVATGVYQGKPCFCLTSFGYRFIH